MCMVLGHDAYTLRVCDTYTICEEVSCITHTETVLTQTNNVLDQM